VEIRRDCVESHDTVMPDWLTRASNLTAFVPLVVAMMIDIIFNFAKTGTMKIRIFSFLVGTFICINIFCDND